MYTVELYNKDRDVYTVVSNYEEEEKDIAIEVCKAINVLRCNRYLIDEPNSTGDREFDWVQVTDDNTGKPIFVNNEEYKA